MDIKDHKLIPLHKVVVDFGVVDDEEYSVLCATSFGYQGRACETNLVYEEVSDGPWWAFWRKSGANFMRRRVTAAFEFPGQEWIDIWLAELPKYIKEV